MHTVCWALCYITYIFMDSCDIYSVIETFSLRFFLPRVLVCQNAGFPQSIFGTLNILRGLFFIRNDFQWTQQMSHQAHVLLNNSVSSVLI